MDIFKIIGWLLLVGGGLFVLTALTNWGDGEYITALIMGLAAVVVGFMLTRDGTPADEMGETDDLDNEDEQEEAKPEVMHDDRATFSIISSEEAILDKVAQVLAKEDRILSIVDEGGRYYSVPDGDDLPPWYALRIGCLKVEEEELMAWSWQAIADELGEDVANSFTISHYG